MSGPSTVMVMFALALACALATTPAVRAAATRIGFFDRPAARKLHGTPIPLLGGVAIYAAVLLSVLLFGRHYLQQLAVILLAASCMALLGLADDRRQLATRIKFAGQAGIALGLYLSGVQVHLGWLPAPLNFCLTLLWLVGITNALNLLDNMDGLAGGVAAVAAAFLTVIAAMNDQYMVASLAAAVLGACCGFLFFNSRPASVFMGDAGSLFLGLLLAVLGIKLRFPDNSSFVTWMVPLLLLGVPIFDTTLVTVSRLRRGVNPFTTPGKDHLSHRLVQRGRSQLEAVLMLYVAGCFCGLLAVFVMQASATEGYLVGATVLACSALLVRRLEQAPSAPPPRREDAASP